MTESRDDHTATLLKNGTVLITGGANNNRIIINDSAELYDPATGAFKSLNPSRMTSPRTDHRANLLPNGKVLITGGFGGPAGYLNTAELFDPADGSLTVVSGAMSSGRWEHTATVLESGKVLICGGRNATTATDTADLFDPVTNNITPVLSRMTSLRYEHAAIRLADGKVLIAGGNKWNGQGGNSFTNTAEVFDPVTQTFTALRQHMTAIRNTCSVTQLRNGKILFAGGYDGSGLKTAEVFDPNSQTFGMLPNMMNSTRWGQTASSLPTGKVLLAGGYNGTAPTDTAEVFDPDSQTFTSLSPITMTSPRWNQRATVLENGTVLITGGYTGAETTTTAEVYGVAPAQPLLQISSVSRLENGHFLITGSYAPLSLVTIQASLSLDSSFAYLGSANADATGFFEYEDSINGASVKFYRAQNLGSL